MNFGDPELELIDPTPNIYSLFTHFDKLFFWTKLASRAVVRWSKRMYSCAGVCSYEGRSGICDIALSEPLLKLRPRKDLVETLLHEMIHAYLFITNKDRDRDGHGPNFKAHMHRINKCAGLNISIYHDFHDEVKLYLTHWWRCNGPCQRKKPHFGIVRRSMNRPPGPSDCWWNSHKIGCGGTFTKIKEPQQQGKKTSVQKPEVLITKYINNNNKIVNNNVPTPILIDCSNIPVKSNVTSAGIVAKKKAIDNMPTPLFNGKGYTVDGNRHRSNSVGVVETVRTVWLNKQLPSTPPKTKIEPVQNNNRTPVQNNNINSANPNKHKIQTQHTNSPPSKINKIDNYFKTAATTVLKDIYGQDFKVTQSNDGKKLVAVTAQHLVDCPVCRSKVKCNYINTHLDECLNKDLIKNLSNELVASTSGQVAIQSKPHVDTNKLKEIVGPLPTKSNIKEINDISKFKIENKDIKLDLPSSLNLSFMDDLVGSQPDKAKGVAKSSGTPEPTNNAIKPSKPPIKPEPLLNMRIQTVPGTSKITHNMPMPIVEQICPCCSDKINKPVEQHLDECRVLQNFSTTIVNGSSAPNANDAIVIDDDDDIFDESQTLNATGTKTPCPCCMKMIEQDDMNSHLDMCLGIIKT